MSLDPRSQYTTESNPRARQRLWKQQRPKFDVVGWVLDLAGLESARHQRVLDVGCGNGMYLRELTGTPHGGRGLRSLTGHAGRTATHPQLVNADVTRLPFATSVFDVVLAPHMLYHVADRELAAFAMRRVLKAVAVASW